MRSFAILLASAYGLAACAAPLQSVTLVNQTGRALEQVFVYPAGATDHGVSRATLAPGASTTIQVKPGHVEVLGVSAKMKIDEHTRDKPTASQELELTGPSQVVFYDQDAPPAGLQRPGVFGIAFRLLKPKPEGEVDETPASEAP
jgi:hypothetical protein